MRNAPQTCTAGGRRADALWFNGWVVGKLALPVARCPSCRRAEPDGTRVEKGRQVRYGTDPGGRSSGSYGEHQAV
jgi:hypothetical protein